MIVGHVDGSGFTDATARGDGSGALYDDHHMHGSGYALTYGYAYTDGHGDGDGDGQTYARGTLWTQDAPDTFLLR